MTTIVKKTLLISMIILLATACNDKESSPLPPSGNPTYEVVSLSASTELALTKNNNDFSCRLFREILKEQEKSNVFISPLSASLALSMLANGAAGVTEKEMLATLGFSGYSADELNAYYQKLIKQLLEADASVDLGIANSIWIEQDFSPVVNPLFLAVNKACYDAEVRTLPFDEKALAAINNWCKEKTKGCIPSILNEMSGNEVMYLINALYFKGTWKRTFDKENTSDRYFTKADGSRILIPMMQKLDTVSWASDETITAIELPYGNEAFNMTVLLPQEGKTIEDAIAALTPENWKKWDAMFTGTPHYQKPFSGLLETDIVMPKFKIEWDMLLNDILKAMGMPSAFEPLQADFSTIASGLYISIVKQKTFVKVDEEGTEAAAVTAIGVENASNPEYSPKMHLDRPFLFAIREKASGAILFLGKMDEPKTE